MKTADVVIGANFGDEGKGLMTDYYAAQSGDALVVRFNGGAQAGHTVVTPDGMRHVFNHIGSGSFAGAVTLLSRFFVCNPLLFRKEHDIISPKLSLPAIYVDAATIVTTPYDMMINQIAEDLRGNGRHGSCGMGFGETIERCISPALSLSYAELADKPALRQKLCAIRKDWLPLRLAKLGFAVIPEKWQERVSSDALLDKFMDDAEFFLQATKAAAPNFLADAKKHLVFEGAQGLMLDQQRGIFPHVTRSHTGIKNVLSLAADAGIGALDVTYATRAYLTRHGAGPLAHELPQAPGAGIRDETNITNDWQGSLRFAHLDIATLAGHIRDDLSDNNAVKINHGIAVTCLDQLGAEITFAENGKIRSLPQHEFLAFIKNTTDANFLCESRGPSRTTISRGMRAAA